MCIVVFMKIPKYVDKSNGKTQKNVKDFIQIYNG